MENTSRTFLVSPKFGSLIRNSSMEVSRLDLVMGIVGGVLSIGCICYGALYIMSHLA